MRAVSAEYVNLRRDTTGRLFTPAGQLVPQQLQDIAVAFVILQHARHRADYDTDAVFTRAEADEAVLTAEVAFLDWAVVQADSGADTFLAELLCRGIPKR
jgi:hypothetical protein